MEMPRYCIIIGTIAEENYCENVFEANAVFILD